MTEEEKQKIIEELKLQKAYAHKINNLQIKMITGCALNLIQKQDTEINKLKQENEQLKSELGYTRKLIYTGDHIPGID